MSAWTTRSVAAADESSALASCCAPLASAAAGAAAAADERPRSIERARGIRHAGDTRLPLVRLPTGGARRRGERSRRQGRAGEPHRRAAHAGRGQARRARRSPDDIAFVGGVARTPCAGTEQLNAAPARCCTKDFATGLELLPRRHRLAPRSRPKRFGSEEGGGAGLDRQSDDDDPGHGRGSRELAVPARRQSAARASGPSAGRSRSRRSRTTTSWRSIGDLRPDGAMLAVVGDVDAEDRRLRCRRRLRTGSVPPPRSPPQTRRRASPAARS